jgi:Putative prokaryotic signal transducing protein
MEELSTVRVVRSEPEAELLCGLLRSSGITCTHRPTNLAAGAMDGATSSFGPREVVVNAADVEAARELVDAERG